MATNEARPVFVIGVVGGGPAGLCFARIVQRTVLESRASVQVQVKVFEGDASRSSRAAHGGSLDLHAESGLRALGSAGLLAEFKKFEVVGGDTTTILNSNADVLYSDKGDGSRPEIERADLWSLLLDSLEEGTVRWNHKLVSLQPSKTGNKVVLSFANGVSETVDFVVGADGAWSKVRPHLSSVSPAYTGVSFFDITLPKTTVHSLPIGGFFSVDGKGTSVSGHIFEYPHIYVGVKCSSPEEFKKVKSPLDALHGWSPVFTSLVKDDHLGFIRRDLVALPTGFTWAREGSSDHWKWRLALIGDAAHVMSPFAGEGVNMALSDAADLAINLMQSIHALDKIMPPLDPAFETKLDSLLQLVVDKFERKYMWPRAKSAAKESAENLIMFYGDGSKASVSAEELAAKFKEMMSVTGLVKRVIWMGFESVKEFVGL